MSGAGDRVPVLHLARWVDLGDAAEARMAELAVKARRRLDDGA